MFGTSRQAALQDNPEPHRMYLGLQAAEVWGDNAIGGAGEMDNEIPQSSLIILEHRGECRQKAQKQNFCQRVRNHSC